MAFLRIHCGYCGGIWEVYHRQRELDQSLRCPHCDSKIDPATWRDKVLPAYNSMHGANMGLIDDHMKFHCPGFEVDFIADGTFQNAGPEYDALEDLKTGLYEVSAEVRKLAQQIRATSPAKARTTGLRATRTNTTAQDESANDGRRKDAE